MTLTAKTRTKIMPAPLGFPAESLPSWANALPASLGSLSPNLAVKKTVAAKANKIPTNANNASYCCDRIKCNIAIFLSKIKFHQTDIHRSSLYQILGSKETKKQIFFDYFYCSLHKKILKLICILYIRAPAER